MHRKDDGLLDLAERSGDVAETLRVIRVGRAMNRDERILARRKAQPRQHIRLAAGDGPIVNERVQHHVAHYQNASLVE